MPPTHRKSPAPSLPVVTADPIASADSIASAGSSAPDQVPSATSPPAAVVALRARELGGAAGPEPTRFGDWEKNGRCIDF